MRPDRSLTVVTLVHSGALALLFGYALFAPKPKPVVAVFELVSAERPKLRPLAPKTPEPPPVEKPPESRPPEAPALTSKPKNPVPSTKPEPKVARPTPPDTSLRVKEVARENSSTTVQVENSPSDPRLAFWAGRVKKRVEPLWNPPKGIDAQSGAKTIISFEVQRNGDIEEVTVKQSSGNALLDDLAKRTILRLERVAPIPDNFPGDLLKVSYEFIYNGN